MEKVIARFYGLREEDIVYCRQIARNEFAVRYLGESFIVTVDADGGCQTRYPD